MAEDFVGEDELILVDGLDREVGRAPKMRAHREGLLHRAFSVVLVRECVPTDVILSEGRHAPEVEGPPFEILLSRRAEGKYHSGGLWANSCCSHPRAGETVPAAVQRRVCEELGCTVAPDSLREIGTYVYRAEFANGLAEYEYDHVLLGFVTADCVLAPDSAEVAEVRWVSPEVLAAELAASPEAFAAWAPGVLAMALRKLRRLRFLHVPSDGTPLAGEVPEPIE